MIFHEVINIFSLQVTSTVPQQDRPLWQILLVKLLPDPPSGVENLASWLEMKDGRSHDDRLLNKLLFDI